MRKRVSFIEEVEGVDCELTHEPCEWQDILKAKVGDKLVIAYLVQDTDYRDIDDMMGDCMGTLYSFHRHAGRDDHSNGLEALGNNSDGEANLDRVWDKHEAEAIRRYLACVMHDHKAEEIREQLEQDGECGENILAALIEDAKNNDWGNVAYYSTMRDVLEKMWSEPEFFPGDRDAQLLACYDHGGQVWSLSGSGMQCRWDTSNKAGVWVPDECLRKQLDDDEAAGKNRDDQARMYCKQFLSEYNAIISGDVYGCVVETFDENGEQIDENACWGFIGGDYAPETLKDGYFDPTCEAIQKQYEHDVLTQCDKQVELL